MTIRIKEEEVSEATKLLSQRMSLNMFDTKGMLAVKTPKNLWGDNMSLKIDWKKMASENYKKLDLRMFNLEDYDTFKDENRNENLVLYRIEEELKNLNTLSVVDEDIGGEKKPLSDINSSDIPNVTGEQLLLNKMEGVPMLVNPIFHKVGLAALDGSSDTGKSSLLRHLSVCIVTGRDFLGWKVEATHKRVYYVSSEDGEDAVTYLLQKQNIDFGLKPDELKELIYIFETANLIEKLDRDLTEKPADLIVIDAFSDIFSGGINETNQVRIFLNEYNQLALKHKLLIIFLHHTNKRSDNNDPSKNNALGSQGFEAKMRLMIELKTNVNNPSKKHFCIVKGNYLDISYKTHSFDLMFNENMTFTNLDTRTHFSLLKKETDKVQAFEEEIQEIKRLQSEGLTFEAIGLRLDMAKSTISKNLKKHRDLEAMKTNAPQ